MFDWFNQKDKNKELKLWQMSESQKFYYARYLGAIGVYHEIILRNFDTAISYLNKSLNIVDKFDDDEANYSLKFSIMSNISESQILLGNIALAKEFLKKIEELAKQGVIQEIDISTMYTLKSALCEMQGKYKESLEYVDKATEIFIKNGFDINAIALSEHRLYRVSILNSLGRYQEAYTQAQQIYDIYKLLKHKNNKIFADIYTEMAKSELGLGKVDKASEYINQAISIGLIEENTIHDKTNYSKNLDLAVNYIVQGNILFAQDKLKQAIKSYKEAFVIFHYLYGDRKKCCSSK
ncbi:MAG: hypothetical protein LF884_02720 [Rickettsia endosymbiont of Cimex lectularius]|nr:MAG: hypothetical protein LF884_02720 [Rickettsia endosymbiont of Cimex lectularius]